MALIRTEGAVYFLGSFALERERENHFSFILWQVIWPSESRYPMWYLISCVKLLSVHPRKTEKPLNASCTLLLGYLRLSFHLFPRYPDFHLLEFLKQQEREIREREEGREEPSCDRAHGEGILLSKGNGKGEKGRGRPASGYRCCSSRVRGKKGREREGR